MNSSDSKEVVIDDNKKYQKVNFFVSLLLILLIFLVSFLNNAPIIILIALPAMFILTYCEEKFKFTIKSYSRYIYLINSVSILTFVIFWIFPNYFGLTLINIQFIIFSLSLYFLFQIFLKLGYFKEKNVLVLQNFLAVTTFTIILYSFFPLIELVYINFTSDPILTLISEVLIHSIIILIITLISFYFLYARVHLYENPRKLFNFCVITVFLFTELAWFALFNLKNFALGVPDLFQRELFLSTIILSVIFLLFILLNYGIKVFSREISLFYTYITFWFLISSIFLIILAFYWNNLVILLSDLICFTILSLCNLKFGTFIKKIEEKTFVKIARIFYYALMLEIFFLFYGIFNTVFLFNQIIAGFLSLCVIGALFNLLSSTEKIISRKMKLILTTFIFAFNIYIIGYYFIQTNINYFYFYLVVPVILCLLLYAPLSYLYREDVIKRKVLALYSYTSSWLLLVVIFVLNFFIINIYFSTDLILGTLLNFLFLTFCLVLLISFGKKISRLKESSSKFILNILSYPIIIEFFALIFTFFTIYLNLDVFLSSFLSFSIVSVVFSLLSKEGKLFPRFPAMILNTMTFFFGVFIGAYYSVIFTAGTFFLYFVPVIVVCLLSYIPIFYLYKRAGLNHKAFLVYHFFCSFIITLAIFVLNIFIVVNFFNYLLILLNLLNVLYITVVSNYIFKFGAKINILSSESFKRYSHIVNYVIILDICLLLFTIFTNYLLFDVFLSSFLSLSIVSVVFNLLSKEGKLFPRFPTMILNTITFFFGVFIGAYYGVFFTAGTFLIYFIPLIVICLLLYIPIFYLYKVTGLNHKTFLVYHFICSSIIALAIFVLNIFVISNFFSNFLMILNLINVLYIAVVSNYIFKYGAKINILSSESFKKYSHIVNYIIILDIFLLLFTIFANYLYIDVLLSSFISLSIVSIVFNLLSKEEKLFPKFPAMILSTITLYFGIFIAGYYSVFFTVGSFFLYFIPLIVVCLLSYIPIFYLYKETGFNLKILLSYHFFCSGIIALAIFILNFFVIDYFFNILLTVLILINILYISVASNYIFKLGAKINILSNEIFKKFSRIISYFIIVEIYAILFSIFYQEFLIEPVLSAYFSTIIICLIINILSKNRFLFSEKSAIGINILALSFTSLLSSYYIYLIVYSSVLVPVIPLLVFTSLMLLPLFYCSNKKVFSKFIGKMLLIDSLLISALIISLPTVIGLELTRFGIFIDYYFIIISTLVLFLMFMRFLEFLFDNYKFKENYVVSLKSSQIAIWIVISIFITLEVYYFIDPITNNFWLNIGISCLTFFFVNLAILIPLENLKQRIFENDASKFDYYKIYKIYEYAKNITFFAIITSIAAIITLIIPSHTLLSLLYLPDSLIVIAITNLGIFMLVYLILSAFSGLIFEIDFLKVKDIFEIITWVFIKFLIFLFIFTLPVQISIILRIILPLLIIIFMSPITMAYLRRIFAIPDESLRLSKKFTFYLFSIAIITIFVDLFWTFSTGIPFFSSNQILQIIVVVCVIYLFYNYYIFKFNSVVERASESRMIRIFSISSLALFSFFSIFPSIFKYLTYIIFFIMLILLISNRNRNFLPRVIFYITLSWFTFVKVIFTLNLYIYIPTFSFNYLDFYMFTYSFSLILVIFLSIVLNMTKTNVFEKFALYSLISINCLLLLTINTIIPLLYNISISLFIFLVLTANYFYRQKDERYKWFIRPCVLLLTFGLMSYISYFFLFNNPYFVNFKQILTFSLTSTITGIAYVGTYNKTPEKFRKITFYIAFSIYTISFPIFVYFFLNALFSLQLWDVFLFLISINIGIVLFYISIGVYYWKFSLAIWKTGWRLWIFVPFVNFYIINEIFTDVNIYTNALNFFDVLSINGSFVISFVICILLSLPFWYSWIKKHFSQVLIIVWSFSLFFLYWFSQNVFPDNIVIRNIVFVVFAISLLVPLIYRLKMWKIMTVLWLSYIFVNISFLIVLFLEIGLPLEINISINIIIIGLFFLVLSFFPNLKNIQNLILVGSYLTSLIGIFLTILNILNAIILNFYISINIALIILALSLFSSRFLKLNKNFFNIIISSILVINFSLFTYNTLILIPGFEILSIFLAITVFGGSLFIFNKFKMIIPLKKIIPLTILSLGVSLSLSYLTYLFLPGFIYLTIAVFILANSVFLRSLLYEYRSVLWYAFPIPIILITSQFIVLNVFFQSPFTIFLIFLIQYTALFQIPCIIYGKMDKDQESRSDYGLLRVNSILLLFLHFEIGLLCFNLISEILKIGFFESALISVLIFFTSTLFEIHLVKKLNEKIIYSFNLIAYILISIGAFIYLNQFTTIDLSIFVLNLVILLTLQFYTLYALVYYIEKLSQYEPSNIKKVRNQIQSILMNSIFIIVSLYISLLLSNLLISFNPLLSGYPSLSFTGIIFSLLMFILNGLLNRTIEIKNRNIILFSAFICFQFFFAVFWISFFLTFNLLDLLRAALILISETIFTAFTIYVSGKITKSEKWKDTAKKIYSFIIFCIYLETSILFFGVFQLFLGFYESLLFSQIVFFLISILDITLIKKVNEKIMYPFNIITYILISISLFVFLHQFTTIDFSIFILNIVIFLTLQFYTLYACSHFIEVVTQSEPSKIRKVRDQIQSILLNSIFIIVSFYISLMLSNLLISYNPSLSGYPSLSLFGLIFSLLMFILNGILNRTIEIKNRNRILFSAFICFQFFFAVFWMAFFILFGLLDLFKLSLILISETVFTSYTIFLSRRITKSEKWKETIKKIYSFIIFCIYLETSILFFGLFQLFLGFFESLLISQIILFLISILEIYAIKRLKEGAMQIVHSISFINISWVLFIILYSVFSYNMFLLVLIVFLMILMQFYTNYSYFDIRRKFNPEKLSTFVKWKKLRQDVLGWGVYTLLLFSIFNILVLVGFEIISIIVILSLISHLLAWFDKYSLKFLGKISNFFISLSWVVLIGFSILFYINWILIFSFQIIPIIILLLIIQFVYLFRLLKDWELIKSKQSVIKGSLLKLVYLNLFTWLLYYITPDIFISLNLVLLSFTVLLGLTFLDNYIKAVNEKIRKNLRVISFVLTEILLSTDIFLLLELFVAPNIILNLSISLFFFMIVNLALFKPFKRKRSSAFLYVLVIFLLLSTITFNLSLSSWSFSWIFIGILLYMFIFMLEELKAFFNNIIDNLRLMVLKLKNVLLSAYYSFVNFFKKNIRAIAIILCIFTGIIVGITFSEIGLVPLLIWYHATLLALAISGILISLIPPKKTDDIDIVFRNRMRRFITLWVSFTFFVFLLILPYITSFLFAIILILSSIIILGAILAIYIYRIEKKQKISIKWRFYTTVILIILAIIWALLIVLFYLIEII